MNNNNKIYNLATIGVQQLIPYKAGKPIEELERELGLTRIIKLASNENPLGPGKKALAAIELALPSLALYPDGSGFFAACFCCLSNCYSGYGCQGSSSASIELWP